MRHGVPFLEVLRWARRWPALSSFVGVAAFCGFSMAFLDRPLAVFWKATVSGEIEGFLKIVARLGEGQAWYILGGVGLVGCWIASRRASSPERAAFFLAHGRGALFFLVSLAASGLVLRLAKFAFGRSRPQGLFADGLYGFYPFSGQWLLNSFPSGHSQTIWAAMIALLLIYPRYDVVYLALALLVSLSRMLTTAHYLSDVVMGSYLGIAITLWVYGHFERKGGSVRRSSTAPSWTATRPGS